jgi:ABC-2 type transport system ATP-binding protein
MLQSARESRTRQRPALTVANAAHRYGGRRALDGVSLAIGRGEIYSLLGPNGAGKSTLLKAISGRLAVDDGDIRIDGAFTAREAAARHLIGYVPQDIALYMHLTVQENLAFFARMVGLKGNDASKAVAVTLKRAALEPQAHQITGTLSGGYQRRVNIAAAALNEPLLLVLDEPTVGIDVHAREQIHALIRVLSDAGAAILLTTHDLDQAQALSDRVGALKEGRLVLEGEPSQLLADAFGDMRELIVELAHTANAREQAWLKNHELQPMQSMLHWRADIPPDHFDVAAFTSYLAEQGLDIKEVRVRKPDLTSLFLKLVGEDRNP